MTDWNATAVALPIASPPVLARSLAAMHGAMHDAINALEPRYESYRFKLEAPPPGASKDAAAAPAAHDVLAALVPAQKAGLDSALSASLAKIEDGTAKADGIRVGKSAAERVLALRATDNFDAKAQDNPGTAPGAWQRTYPEMAPGVMPQLGGVTPFLLTAADQFVTKGRPLLTSEEFARDVDEVKKVGSRHSSTRSAEQTAAAIFWAGNEVPILNAAARAASRANKLSVHENARLFALVCMAAADAAIATFRIKYKNNDWRPITAIRAGYGPLAADPGWESLLITPPHPEFASAHCALMGAVTQVLRELIKSDQVEFNYVFPPALGTMRSYTSLSQLAREVEDARVWGGIHFRSTDEQSTELGRTVGVYAVGNFLRPLSGAGTDRKSP